MTEVIGIGSALFDILMTADGFPKEDTKMKGSSTRLQCGGPCATALVTMRKLGIGVQYMGTLGDDMYGNFIRREFTRFGVEHDMVRTVEGGQSFHSFVLINTKKSTRTCIWNKGTLLPAEVKDVDLEALRRAKYLHLDGHQLEAAIYAAGKAKEFGVKVSLDAGGAYPGIERLLPLVDVLIPSEEFAHAFTGAAEIEVAATILEERFQPEILIITQGKKGGFIWKDKKAVRYPVYPVNAIDTNGAGDTFHGAFLVGRIKEMSVTEAATFASAVSAFKCTRFGAQDGIPGYEETMEFMKTHRGEIRK